MTLVIRSIHESTALFDINRREGTFFKPVNGKFVLMTDEEQKDFTSTNFAVGYEGKDPALCSWKFKNLRGLCQIVLEGDSIAEKRQILWQQYRGEEDKQLPYILKKIIEKVSQGKVVTIWYLSKHDIAKAELIKKFVDWYIANH